jgi:hypothetical protein
LLEIIRRKRFDTEVKINNEIFRIKMANMNEYKKWKKDVFPEILKKLRETENENVEYDLKCKISEVAEEKSEQEKQEQEKQEQEKLEIEKQEKSYYIM